MPPPPSALKEDFDGAAEPFYTFCFLMFLVVVQLATLSAQGADDQARVFITDSTSWEISGRAGGSGGVFGDACAAITKDCEHGSAIRTAQAKRPKRSCYPATAAPQVAPPQNAKISISSIPLGADIEIDGSFIGNTPSAVEISPGDHTIAVKKQWLQGLGTKDEGD